VALLHLGVHLHVGGRTERPTELVTQEVEFPAPGIFRLFQSLVVRNQTLNHVFEFPDDPFLTYDGTFQGVDPVDIVLSSLQLLLDFHVDFLEFSKFPDGESCRHEIPVTPLPLVV
jgi:hypothetical protein